MHSDLPHHRVAGLIRIRFASVKDYEKPKAGDDPRTQIKRRRDKRRVCSRSPAKPVGVVRPGRRMSFHSCRPPHQLAEQLVGCIPAALVFLARGHSHGQLLLPARTDTMRDGIGWPQRQPWAASSGASGLGQRLDQAQPSYRASYRKLKRQPGDCMRNDEAQTRPMDEAEQREPIYCRRKTASPRYPLGRGFRA